MIPEDVQKNLDDHKTSDNAQFGEIKESMRGMVQNQVKLAEAQSKINSSFEEHTKTHEAMNAKIDQLTKTMNQFIQIYDHAGFLGKLFIQVGIYAGAGTGIIFFIMQIRNFLSGK